MKFLLAIPLLCLALACSKPDPFDTVRQMRRDYKIENLDFMPNDATNELTVIFNVRNTVADMALQDLTVTIDAMDENQKTFWSKNYELSVGDIAQYGSKEFQFKEPIGDAKKLVYLNVYPADDSEGAGFKSYPEFMRVVK